MKRIVISGQIRNWGEKMSKGLKTVWNIFTWLVVFIIVLLAVLLVGVRLLGYTPYAVISPSMYPAYHVGDLIYVRQAMFEDIEVGDAITYVANEDLLVVTHRVVEIDVENKSFTTKGDANESNDASPVAYANVVGVVGFSVPGLGFVSNYITSESGRYMAIAVLAGLMMLLILPELFKKDEKKRPKDA